MTPETMAQAFRHYRQGERRSTKKLVLRELTPEEKRARLLALKDVERERKKRPPQSK
jgi:hypothetical protein